MIITILAALAILGGFNLLVILVQLSSGRYRVGPRTLTEVAFSAVFIALGLAGMGVIK